LDSKLPPGVTTYRNMFSVLEKREETKNLVNVLGSNVTYDKTSELKRLLKTKGYRVANIADYTDFDSFMEMASARLNLVVSPIALKTAEMMEKEFGIPYLTAYITYDPEEITEVYRKLEKALDLDFSPALEEEKEKADLRAMDEELVANLVRGRFLSGIIVDESEKDADSKAENPDGNTEDGNIEEAKESETEEEQPKKKNNIRVPYVNNQNGEMYQAIFTDGYELQRFDPKKRLRPVVVKFDDLEKFLVKDAKGFLLNPTSTALPLRREQLPAFKKRIDG